MSIAPGFEAAQRGEAVGSWLPARYTPTLTGDENFITQGDKLIAFGERYWSTPEIEKLQLDPWQEWLIRHVLEVYPDDWPVAHLRGQLRYRQVLISVGRQNGKSLLAALFVIYFLALHVKGPRVIGLASIDRQAKIVYDRVKYGIDNHPALVHNLRTTGTRGIHRRDGSGVYFTLPAKEESAQGEPATGSIYDELHLGLKALWDALVLAQRAKPNALMVGITTAGDDASDLLIKLYGDAEAAIAGTDERFGAFIWEADSDELTEAGVIAANPAVACGRIPLDLTMAEAAKMWRDNTPGPDGLTGRQRVIRYTLNRFISGAADAWAPTNLWTAAADPGALEHSDRVVYSIERTRDWEHASIRVTSLHEGRYTSELIATINDPDLEQLDKACRLLSARGPATFAMDSFTLSALGNRLRDDGYDVWKLGASEMMAAAQHAYGLISRQAITHPGDPLCDIQMARARRRTTGDGWRLSRSLSRGHIDTVIGLVIGLYVAASRTDDEPQLF